MLMPLGMVLGDRNCTVTGAWGRISNPLPKSKAVSLAAVMLSHRWCSCGCEMGDWTGVLLSSRWHAHPGYNSTAVVQLNTKWGKSCVYGLLGGMWCSSTLLPDMKELKGVDQCTSSVWGQHLQATVLSDVKDVQKYLYFPYTNDFWFKSNYNCFCLLITGIVSLVTQLVRLKLYDLWVGRAAAWTLSKSVPCVQLSHCH